MNNQENLVSDSTSGAIKNSQATPFSVDATLRLIATLPPPAGLEDRIHAGLLAQLDADHRREGSGSRVLAWPSSRAGDSRWVQNDLLRGAAAAAIVAVVLGGSWGISARFRPANSAKGIALPNRVAGPGGFSSAGAMRTPQTLHGPVVLPALTPLPSAPFSPVKSKTLKKPLLPSASGAQNKAETKLSPAVDK